MPGKTQQEVIEVGKARARYQTELLIRGLIHSRRKDEIPVQPVYQHSELASDTNRDVHGSK